VILDDLG